ncbi:MAG: hypothetical protein HKN23_14530 [Verrucomicrobiales bacterium]|nr:hypothetical protein [Verrucomicrobiales bacterium]
MSTFLQNASLLLLAILLAAPQQFAVAFCTCTGEIFGEVCPCEERAEESSIPCPLSNECDETLDFERDDFLPKQDGFRVSLDSIGPTPEFGASKIGFNMNPNLNADSGLFTARFGHPTGTILQTSCVFAKFVNLRV